MLQKQPGKVGFHFQDRVSVRLTERRKLKDFLRFMIAKEKHTLCSLEVIFCSDKTLLGINREFLQHDYYTDIITFNLREDAGKPIEGEIYISVDRVRENAQVLNETQRVELHRVIFHGLLHLCGYKDKTDKEIRLMRKMESFYLKQYLY